MLHRVGQHRLDGLGSEKVASPFKRRDGDFLVYGSVKQLGSTIGRSAVSVDLIGTLPRD